MDVIDWPQEKIDALLKEYSETEDIDVTLQNMGKRIEELERIQDACPYEHHAGHVCDKCGWLTYEGKEK